MAQPGTSPPVSGRLSLTMTPPPHPHACFKKSTLAKVLLVGAVLWLLPMVALVALGETTPGPLIMVVAFVAFLGGWSKQVLGPEALFLGAALAATVVTWFTFLPSFVFILAGGPLVESTHGKLGVMTVIAICALAGLGCEC